VVLKCDMKVEFCITVLIGVWYHDVPDVTPTVPGNLSQCGPKTGHGRCNARRITRRECRPMRGVDENEDKERRSV